MPVRVRVGTTRGGSSGGAGQPVRGAPQSVSAFGTDKGYGFNPVNPHAYLATVGAKAYKTDKGTQDWDGPGISPPIR